MNPTIKESLTPATRYETTVHLICEVMKFIAIMSMLAGMLWAGPKVARWIDRDKCIEVKP